jgi:hypothetical protein
MNGQTDANANAELGKIQVDLGRADVALKKVDEELKKTQVDLGRADVALKKAELKSKLPALKNALSNPLVLGALITAFVALNSSIITYFSSTQQHSLDAAKFQLQTQLDQLKFQNERELNERRFRADLILKMIATGNPDQARENLSFLLDAGLLPDSDNRLRNYLEERRPGDGPRIPDQQK